MEQETIGQLQAQQLLAESGDIASWRLEDHQMDLYSQVAELKHREYAFICSRRWGKSFLSLTIACEYSMHFPGSITLIMAPTLKQGYEIVDGILAPHFSQQLANVMTQSKTRLSWNFVNGSKLIIGTCERAHSDSSRGAQSPNLVIWEESAAAVTSDDFEYVYKSVVGPAAMRTNAIQIFCTTLSSEPSHFLHTSVIPRCIQRGTYYERDIYTNSALSQAQIDEAILMAGGVTNEHCQRELLCKLIKSQSLSVFPEYQLRPTAVVLPASWYCCLVGDLGGVKDKTVFGVVVYDYYRKRTYIIDELVYDANTPSDKIVDDLLVWEQVYAGNIKWRYLDAPGQVLVDLNSKGLKYNLPPKHDKESAVNAARIALNNKQLVIDTERCKFTHASCFNARWSTSARETFDRDNMFGHFDAVDMVIYAYRVAEFMRNLDPTPAINSYTTWQGSANLEKLKQADLVQLAKPLRRKMS